MFQGQSHPQGEAPGHYSGALPVRRSIYDEPERAPRTSAVHSDRDAQQRIAAFLGGQDLSRPTTTAPPVRYHDEEDFDMMAPTKMPVMSSISEEKKLRIKWRYAIISGLLSIIAIIIAAVLVSGNKEPPPFSKHDVEVILRDASEIGGFEFDIPSSYQYKAMQWNMNNPVNSRKRLLQRYALVCVFYSTFQVSNEWLQTNHPGEELFPWDSSRGWLTFDNECDWVGVDCDAQGNVIELDLGKNDLSGQFPREISNLASTLVSLNIEGNYFYNKGPEETSFLGRLHNLKYLYLKDSLIQHDGLPKSIGKLSDLEELDCSYSLLHGPLEADIFRNLRQLKYFEISGNSISGPIPSTLSYLPRLKYFYASDCDLIEQDLDFLLTMPSIIEVWLDRNPNLTGTIPATIQNVKTLESISLTECGMTGSIPSEMGRLTEMQQIWLYRNLLTGTIPTELGRMTDLETLALEATNLVGYMPTEVCLNRSPSGVLEKLHANCATNVTCSCCDCCGEACADGPNDITRRKKRAL